MQDRNISKPRPKGKPKERKLNKFRKRGISQQTLYQFLFSVMHQIEMGLKRHILADETRLTEKEPSNSESKLCNHQQFNSRHDYHILYQVSSIR